MLTCGQRRGLQLCRILCHCHIRDYLEPTLESSIAQCELIYALLLAETPDLYAHLVEAGMFSHIAISWILTWFTHDVDDLNTIVRVYDACLASHPFFPTYISAALVMQKQDVLLSLPADMSRLHKALLELPKTANFDTAIPIAHELFGRHSPTSLIASKAISQSGRELLTKSKAAKAYEEFTANPLIFSADPGAEPQADYTSAALKGAVRGAAASLFGTIAVAAIEAFGVLLLANYA